MLAHICWMLKPLSLKTTFVPTFHFLYTYCIRNQPFPHQGSDTSALLQVRKIRIQISRKKNNWTRQISYQGKEEKARLKKKILRKKKTKSEANKFIIFIYYVQIYTNNLQKTKVKGHYKREETWCTESNCKNLQQHSWKIIFKKSKNSREMNIINIGKRDTASYRN